MTDIKRKAPVKVRCAEAADLVPLQKFFRQAAGEVAEGMKCLPNGSKGIYPSAQMIEDAVRHHKVFIALGENLPEEFHTSDGYIMGGMISNHEYNPAFRDVKWNAELKDEDTAYWHCLRVLNACQGRGVARSIITEAIRLEREAGARAVRFDTVIGNDNAIHLYETIGFDNRGIYPVYEEDIGMHESIMYEMIF
ncbi:MAG: GNAT family N-acetyltransferase [Solobacterium sp.]|nr:GNAT family N-acetyltransferase [Solobacterium sp.]